MIFMFFKEKEEASTAHMTLGFDSLSDFDSKFRVQ